MQPLTIELTEQPLFPGEVLKLHLCYDIALLVEEQDLPEMIIVIHMVHKHVERIQAIAYYTGPPASHPAQRKRHVAGQAVEEQVAVSNLHAHQREALKLFQYVHVVLWFFEIHSVFSFLSFAVCVQPIRKGRGPSSPLPVRCVTVCYDVVCLQTDVKRHEPVEQLFSSHLSQIAWLRAGSRVKEPSTSLHNLQRTRSNVLP